MINTKKTLEQFVEDAKKCHKIEYDYSKVVYINNKTKVCIICPEHGEFWQDPHNHLKGKDCPICAKKKTRPAKYTTDSFIEESKKVHGDFYDYSKTKFTIEKNRVCIGCPIHGDFWQLPYLHIHGAGCPICAHEKNGANKRTKREDFIIQANKIHNNKFNYDKVHYITAKNKVCITCPEHGDFYQTPDKHLAGCGCPKCVYPYSKAEIEIYNYVVSLVGKENVEQHNRTLINGQELDIFIPSYNIAIEYNGLYWHTKDKNYHLKKLNQCQALGIGLIQIFEDEYIFKKNIVFSKIAHLLKQHNNLEKIGARKCTISEVTKKEAKDFLNKNHIQGYGQSTVSIGAFYNNYLIGVMTFKKETNPNYWELTRFATDINYVVSGVGGKLLNFFIKNWNPQQIKTFADRRWTLWYNNIYEKSGFKLVGKTRPDYHYYYPYEGQIRMHKFSCRKEKLSKKYNLPLSMTESEMTEKIGYKRIYDCGLLKYQWTKKSPQD